MTEDLGNIMARLKRVEVQNRRMKIVGLVVLVLAGAAFVMGKAAPNPKTIEAEEFVLRDESGIRRGLLAITSELSGSGPSLTLFNPDGREQVEMVATNKESFINLNSADGATLAIIGVNDREATLEFYDHYGVRRIALLAGPTNTWLTMSDPYDNIRMMLQASGQMSELFLARPERKHQAKLIVDEDNYKLIFSDSEGKTLWSAP
jgi:hypothetical protein